MLGWFILSDLDKRLERHLRGIILIDELEQHLHPELQRSIVFQLNKVFPNIQFIATSHSPICAAGLADLDDNNCSLELLKTNGEGWVENESLSTMSGWRYDEILRSPAFGIPVRNIKTQILMDKIQDLSIRKDLNPEQEAKLKELLDDLEKQSSVGKEAAERRRLLVDLDTMKRKLNMEVKEDDQD